MSVTISSVGQVNNSTGTVSVTFSSGEITHTRDINIVRNQAGKYDPAATALRINEVARGVAAKIEARALT